ncbi:MAG TPA: hypothetical protein VGM88_18530 [Kofleriaceae bacterium]|jgi:hypothetical protein
MRTAIAVALALVAGCKSKSTATGEHGKQGSGTPMLGAGSADPTGDAGQRDAPPQPPDQDALAAAARGTHRAALCPSTVAGATTTAEVRGTDVVLTITAADPAAVAAIRERAAKTLAEKSAGSGSGVDADDLCPVRVPAGGTASMKDDPKGVVVSITPKDSLDQLKIDTDGRIDKAQAWARSNTGSGH